MTKKSIIAMLVILVIVLVGGGAYWYFFMGPGQPSAPGTASQTGTSGFQPINRTVSPTNPNSTSTTASTQNNNPAPAQAVIPALRELSSTPVGGYGSMVTASTTLVRWVDRGRGNIYEAAGNTTSITTLSNTEVPRIYTSAWNAKLSAFIASLLQTDDSVPAAVYATLVPQATSTTDLTPFALRGSDLPANIIGYAASPEKDRLFMLVDEGGNGVGYISAFDGSGMTRIFTTPLTQVNVDWPTDSIIAITTKGSAQYGGYLYFVNPKTGVWKKALGPLTGLSAAVSHDGKYILMSATGDSNNVATFIYSVASNSAIDAGIRTLADKCAWGNFYQDLVYCAVPSIPVAGTYPDDWYTGTISTVDQIWQVDAGTGEVKLLSSILDQSNHLVDGFNLGLDAKDNYLFFMNKDDLSLWSLDLVGSH